LRISDIEPQAVIGNRQSANLFETAAINLRVIEGQPGQAIIARLAVVMAIEAVLSFAWF
jgi:hypothetical protein